MKRGGVRPGAGRPKLGLVRKYVSLRPATVEFLKSRCRRRGRPKLPLGRVIDKAIEVARLVM